MRLKLVYSAPMSTSVEIVWNDDHLVVIRKDPGVPSQPDPSGDPSALELAASTLGVRLHPVHRIDRPAGGLLLAAASSEAAATLSRMLRDGSVERRYWAIVEGVVAEEGGRLEHALRTNRRTNRSYVDPRGRRAILTWRARCRGDRYTLVEVALETGRHHQIRAQLAAAIAPIRGDLKYGARRSLAGGGIALHAVGLRLAHPAHGEPRTFVAPVPDDPLWNALAADLEPSFGSP